MNQFTKLNFAGDATEKNYYVKFTSRVDKFTDIIKIAIIIIKKKCENTRYYVLKCSFCLYFLI